MDHAAYAHTETAGYLVPAVARPDGVAVGNAVGAAIGSMAGGLVEHRAGLVATTTNAEPEETILTVR